MQDKDYSYFGLPPSPWEKHNDQNRLRKRKLILAHVPKEEYMKVEGGVIAGG